MTRLVEGARFVVGAACLTAVLAVVWLLLWITVVPAVLGWTPVAIVSGSMSPGIATGDVVLAAPPEAASVGPGSVIVFDNPAGDGYVTHRIVAVDPLGDYATRGDANARIDSTPVSPHAVEGVGRILVPAVGTPVAWAAMDRLSHLLVAAAAAVVVLWAARWAVASPATSTPHPRPVAAMLVVVVAAAGPLLHDLTTAGAAFADADQTTGSSWIADALDPPTGLTATGGATVDLDWTATTDTYASGHRVYRATTSGGPYAQVPQVTPRATVTHTDSPADGTHYYVLRAFYGPWESPDSAEVSATVATAEDYDAIIPAVDNCPSTFNIDQYDTDGDGTGDACDASPTLATSGTFTNGGQTLGSNDSYDAAFGDLDGDGDLDIVYADNNDPNTVWFNDGSGTFTDSGQTLDDTRSEGVALGDLDGDGDLDIVYANDGDPNAVWFNDGSGTFTDSGQALGANEASRAPAVGDLDGDGDLDVAFANIGDPNTVWLNDGAGVLTDSGQTLGTNEDSQGLALGDVDGDGDLDMTFTNDGDPNTVWFNS